MGMYTSSPLKSAFIYHWFASQDQITGVVVCFLSGQDFKSNRLECLTKLGERVCPVNTGLLGLATNPQTFP